MRIVTLSKESRQNLLDSLLKRSPGNYGQYQDTVQEIVDRVKTKGDQALFELTRKFDWEGIDASNVKVTEAEVQEAYDTIDPQLVETIRKSLKNIREYHEKQKQYSWFDTTPEGTMLGQKVTPLASAGVYVPGGKAVYPSSVLMNIVPAKIVGVAHVVMCTPCNKEGKVNPAVLVAAKEAGAEFVKTSTGFSTGGATVADVALMRKTVGPDMGVKASGGVRGPEDAKAMIAAGANRLGTSAGVAIAKGETSKSTY